MGPALMSMWPVVTAFMTLSRLELRQDSMSCLQVSWHSLLHESCYDALSVQCSAFSMQDIDAATGSLAGNTCNKTLATFTESKQQAAQRAEQQTQDQRDIPAEKF